MITKENKAWKDYNGQTKTRLTMLDMDLDQYYKLQEKYANNL